MIRTFVVLIVTLVALAPRPAAAREGDTRLAVIVGLAGDPEHAELFQRWAGTLVDAAGKMGITGDRLVYLTEKPESDPTRAPGKATAENVRAAFTRLAAGGGPDDVVFIVLIGHGTFDGREAKFNLPGPDLTPADFKALLGKLPSTHVVFANTASASGPFVEALAGPGRVVVAATRNGSEKFATLFGGYFVDALAGAEDGADADKNRRVSVLEAFTFAKREVAGAYEREGIMLTEHAILSDDGSAEGTQTPTVDGKQGKVAGMLAMGSATAEALPSDPALRGLYVERRDIERRIETLKLLKDSMEPARYTDELEKLATALALKTRQIRDAEKKTP